MILPQIKCYFAGHTWIRRAKKDGSSGEWFCTRCNKTQDWLIKVVH